MSELEKPKEFSGRDARRGEIARRPPGRKAVLAAGVAGFVLLAVLMAVSGCVPTP